MYDHVRLFARVSAAIANDPALSLGQLARALQIHPHTLAHIIEEQTGGSFSAWRGRQRLAAACQLLESRPDLSIKEIAAATGFNSTSVFDRFFRRSCGSSPSQSRLGAASHGLPSASSPAPAGASLGTLNVGTREPSWSRRQSFGLFVNRQRGTPRRREWQTRIMHCVFVTSRFGSPALRHRTVPTTRRKRCRTRRGGPWRLRGQPRWRLPCQCRRRMSAPSAGLVPGTPGIPSAPKSRSVAVCATPLIRPPKMTAPR